MSNINHKGSFNPMYGKRHNELSKRQISVSQKERYQKLKNAYLTQSASMDDLLNSESFQNRMKQIIREEIIRVK